MSSCIKNEKQEFYRLLAHRKVRTYLLNRFQYQKDKKKQFSLKAPAQLNGSTGLAMISKRSSLCTPRTRYILLSTRVSQRMLSARHVNQVHVQNLARVQRAPNARHEN